MIKVSVLYPHDSAKKFDFDYVQNTHLPMVGRLLSPLGLQSAGLDKGVSTADPNQPAPFVAVNTLIFNTVEEVHQAFITHGSEIMSDIKNYTDITPQIQISEIVT